MNIPSVYRKAIDGFIIPPRTFLQMFVSAGRGAVSLFDETNRTEFIDKLDKGTINEGVVSQATAGPIMMLSLFNDMQNPLFQRHKFDPTEFLEGVGPALENFHNISGGLDNEFYKVQQEAKENQDGGSNEAKKESDEESKDGGDIAKNEEGEAILAALRAFNDEKFFSSLTGDESVAAVMNHEWKDEVKKNPESLAGQLSRMLTTELFQIQQMGAKTAFLLQNHARNIKFQEGSCTVNNVALLSARTYLCVEREDDNEDESSSEGPKYVAVDYDMDEDEMKASKAGVAAQMEILYDVTQDYVAEALPKSEEEGKSSEEVSKSSEPESMQNTVVSVATIEGWLRGGPDGELRWRIALHRPAFEFPGIQQAYS
jgi:hypothetical protein